MSDAEFLDSLEDYVAWLEVVTSQRELEAQIAEKNERVIEALLKGSNPIKLELGAGAERSINGWTTVDMNQECDLCLDLSRPMPLPNDCVSQIYSSHLLEHFSYPEPMGGLLSECYRILQEGGIFSVAVPNAGIYLKGYFEPEKFAPENYCLYQPAYYYNSKIDYVNYIAYMAGHHRYMFDEENLLVILANAGFKNVRLREFDPGLDLEVRRHESIYAEAEK